MKKNKKTIYETPVIIPLGELARGTGMPPPDPRPSCPNGNDASNCPNGMAPTSKGRDCPNGSVASGSCATGVSF